MIPAEAVEAAARGIWEARPMERVYDEGSPDYGAAKPWGEIKSYQRDRCMTLARFALEAAAPHMPTPTPTASERAMTDITALLDGYSKQWRREVDVVMDLHRIVGRYDMERIGEGA